MNGIPDPGAPAGTFAALERTAPIVRAAADGTLTTTSMRIANGTQHEHRAVLKLIRENMADFEEFGRVALEVQSFDTAGGPQRREVAILNEEQATLLMTFMRNIGVVKDFKKRLVREFYDMRRQIAAGPALSEDEIVHQALAITARRVETLTAKVAELEPKAEFFDELMDADGCYSMQATANIIGWGRNVMMRELRRRGVLQGNNLPYRRYSHHFKVIPGTRTHPQTGDLIPTATTHVLPSGIPFIRKKLAGALELAVTE